MSTGYSAGMRRDRIRILNRTKAETSLYGIDGNGIEWEESDPLWVDVSWTKGMRAQNAGAIDVYGIIGVRMNYNSGKSRCISMRSRIMDSEGITYQILPETFHADQHANTIEFRAQAIINDNQP